MATSDTEAKLTEVKHRELGWEVQRLRSRVISWIESSFTPEKDVECRRDGVLRIDMVVSSTPEAIREFLRFSRASLELSDLSLQCEQSSRREGDITIPFKIHMELTAEKRAEYGASHPECLLRQGMLTNSATMSPHGTTAARRKRRSSRVAPMEASPSMGELLDRINRQAAGAPLFIQTRTCRSAYTTPRRAGRASLASETVTPLLDHPRTEAETVIPVLDHPRTGEKRKFGDNRATGARDEGSAEKKVKEQVADDQRSRSPGELGPGAGAHDEGSAGKKVEQQSADDHVAGSPMQLGKEASRTADGISAFPKTPVGPAPRDNTGEMLSASQMQHLLQKFIDDRRATGGVFGSATGVSGSIRISSTETRRIMKAYYLANDTELAEELARLHMVVLGSGAELSAEWKRRCVRSFKGLVTWQHSQGSFVLGHADDAMSSLASTGS